MFRYLPYPDLIRVASAAKEEHVPAGSDVFAEGDTGESLYIILEGRAAVIKSDLELAELTAGAHFGEMSLIERAPRSAGIRAKTPLSLLVLERDGFFSLLREEAAAVKLLWGMVRMLNARLRLTSDELTLLKQQAVGHDE
jgi:CRP-like cAMP-binding protein